MKKMMIFKLLLVFAVLMFGAVELSAGNINVAGATAGDSGSIAVQKTNALVNDTGNLGASIFKLFLFGLAIAVFVASPILAYYKAKGKMEQNNQQSQQDESEMAVQIKSAIVGIITVVVLGSIFSMILTDVIGVASNPKDAIKKVLYIDELYK